MFSFFDLGLFALVSAFIIITLESTFDVDDSYGSVRYLAQSNVPNILYNYIFKIFLIMRSLPAIQI